jgi:hypothetical protein
MASLDNTVVIDSERQPRDRCRGQCRTLGEDDRLPTHSRARAFLENIAKRRNPITYQELAKALQILPPHFIRRVTRLMEENAAADRSFIAAVAISKARGGLPAPGQGQLPPSEV